MFNVNSSCPDPAVREGLTIMTLTMNKVIDVVLVSQLLTLTLIFSSVFIVDFE